MKDGILQVLTEKEELERLRGSESLLHLLIDSLPAFVSYIDSDQRYVFANALYAAFFQRKLSEIIGRSVKEVLGDEVYETVRTHIQAALNGLRQNYQYELPHLGKTRIIRALYVPHIEKGKVKGLFILGIDLTNGNGNGKTT